MVRRADNSQRAEWGARPAAAPLNATGANVTIQKNWQELIRPNKLQVAEATIPSAKLPWSRSRSSAALA